MKFFEVIHQKRQSYLFTYGLAILFSVSIILLKSFVFFEIGYEAPFLMLASAIVLSSLFGGFGPGIITTFINSIYIFLALKGNYPNHFYLLQGIFVAQGFGLSYIIGSAINSVFKEMEAREKLDFTSTHNPLTGLPNKEAFENKVTEMCKLSPSFAVISVDLDKMKDINENWGYDFGNEVIIESAKRLSSFFHNNGFLGHFGGDKFFAALPFSSTVELEESSKSLSKKISAPLDINGKILRLSASIGISIYPINGTKAPELTKNAESVMHRAKATNKGNILFFKEEFSLERKRKTSLAHDIQGGIQRNEFELFYQPIFDIKHQTLLSAEALVRWNHPKFGFLLPGEFIPVAEENGSIIELGYWIFERVCENLRSWKEANMPMVKISVNLSALELNHSKLVNRIENKIKDFKIDPSLLEFEVSESSALKDMSKTKLILDRIRDTGASIAMDDFGTGYASLSYLLNLPIDTIKIDQSFIRSSMQNKNSEIIVKSIILLAYQMNLNYIAEGIENQEQLNFLHNLRCTWVQGFLLGKPMSSQTFYDYLLNIKSTQPQNEIAALVRI